MGNKGGSDQGGGASGQGVEVSCLLFAYSLSYADPNQQTDAGNGASKHVVMAETIKPCMHNIARENILSWQTTSNHPCTTLHVCYTLRQLKHIHMAQH